MITYNNFYFKHRTLIRIEIIFLFHSNNTPLMSHIYVISLQNITIYSMSHSDSHSLIKIKRLSFVILTYISSYIHNYFLFQSYIPHIYTLTWIIINDNLPFYHIFLKTRHFLLRNSIHERLPVPKSVYTTN